MSILANPPKVVPLPRSIGTSAKKVEKLAFEHGRSGVGHIMVGTDEHGAASELRIWRQPRAGDPGQPAGWDRLAPFDTTLAKSIMVVGGMMRQTDPAWYQALVFADYMEGDAFETALTGDAA